MHISLSIYIFVDQFSNAQLTLGTFSYKRVAYNKNKFIFNLFDISATPLIHFYFSFPKLCVNLKIDAMKC